MSLPASIENRSPFGMEQIIQACFDESNGALATTATATIPGVVEVIMDQASDSVQTTPLRGTLTDRSGTTSGSANTSTTVMSANTSRNYLLFQNVSDTDMWVNFGTAATTNQPSFKIVPNGSIVMEAGFVTTQSMTVICSATSKAYTAKESP